MDSIILKKIGRLVTKCFEDFGGVGRFDVVAYEQSSRYLSRAVIEVWTKDLKVYLLKAVLFGNVVISVNLYELKKRIYTD